MAKINVTQYSIKTQKKKIYKINKGKGRDREGEVVVLLYMLRNKERIVQSFFFLFRLAKNKEVVGCPRS